MNEYYVTLTIHVKVEAKSTEHAKLVAQNKIVGSFGENVDISRVVTSLDRLETEYIPSEFVRTSEQTWIYRKQEIRYNDSGDFFVVSFDNDVEETAVDCIYAKHLIDRYTERK